MSRRILTLALAICLLFTVMCAQADDIYPLVPEQITLQGVVFGSNYDQTNGRIVWDEIAKLTGVKIEWTNVGNEQKQVYLAAGEWPDLFHNSFDSTMIEQYGVQAGKLVNLEDYMDYMPHLAAAYEQYPDAKKWVTASDGGVYQLLNVNESNTAANCRYYYRTDILEDLGLDTPTTVDEFFDVLMAIKEETGYAPLADNIAPMQGWQGTAGREWFLYSAFGPSVNPNFEDAGDGTVIYNRLSDQYRYYLQYMNKLYANGLLNNEYLTLDNSTRKAMINEGKIVFGGAHEWEEISDGTIFKNGWSDLSQLAPLTSEYDDERLTAAYPRFSGSSCVINAASPYVKEICQVLDIFYANEEVAEGTGIYSCMRCNGPENLVWEWTNEEHTEWEYILPEDWTESGNEFTFKECIVNNNIGLFNVFAHAFNGAMSNGRARQIGFVNNIIPYQAEDCFPAGKMAMTEDESTVVSEYETEVRTYVHEWNAWFVSGAKDANSDDDWNEYVNGFTALHLDELLGAYQSAYDRWIAE